MRLIRDPDRYTVALSCLSAALWLTFAWLSWRAYGEAWNA